MTIKLIQSLIPWLAFRLELWKIYWKEQEKDYNNELHTWILKVITPNSQSPFGCLDAFKNWIKFFMLVIM